MTLDFFRNENYNISENREHQIFIIDELSKVFGELEVYSEHRNYNHSIELILHFNDVGEYLPIDFHSDDAQSYLLKDKSILFRAIISISDIGPYIVIHWNKLSLIDEKLAVNFIQDEDVPCLPKTHLFKALKNLCEEQKVRIVLQPENLKSITGLVI